MIVNKNFSRGAFITLEGIEGAGKSSQVVPLTAFLRKHGLSVLTTREPGGTPIAERIRTLLLDSQQIKMSVTAELLLLFAARAEHLEKVILPALQDGVWVVCDRFTDATYAYQGGGRGIELRRIAWLENLVQGSISPDLTLLFDLAPRIGLARARNRDDKGDRFEAETIAFFEAVRFTYLARAEENPQRCHIINAEDPQPIVTDNIQKLLGLFLEQFIEKR